MLDVEILVLPDRARRRRCSRCRAATSTCRADERRAARAIPRALEAARAARRRRASATRASSLGRGAGGRSRRSRSCASTTSSSSTRERLEPVAEVEGEMLLVVAVFAGEHPAARQHRCSGDATTAGPTRRNATAPGVEAERATRGGGRHDPRDASSQGPPDHGDGARRRVRGQPHPRRDADGCLRHGARSSGSTSTTSTTATASRPT